MPRNESSFDERSSQRSSGRRNESDRRRKSPDDRRRKEDDSHKSRRHRSPSVERRRKHSRSRSPTKPQRDESPKMWKAKENAKSLSPERSPRRNKRQRSRERDEKRRDSHGHRREEASGNDRKKLREEEDVKPNKNALDGQSKQYGLEERGQKWGKPGMNEVKEEETPTEEKQKVNLGLSGKLTEDTNTFRGVVIKYNEPPEAKKPVAKWRLYPFKGEESLPVMHIHRQSAYLIGRDRKIADLPIDHPSCSKQHAALQFRSIPFVREDGTKARRILPYIIDLSSGNGTFLNGEKIEAQRYVELQEKDVLKFGFSSREFVVMKEKIEEEAPKPEAQDSPE